MKKLSKKEHNLNEKAKILEIFKYTSSEVPAYKKFLKDYKVSPKTIEKNHDYDGIPVMTKDNYLKVYDLFDLVPQGKFPPMVSASSGSSGAPFYWPRGERQEILGGKIHKSILEEIFDFKKNSNVLAIVCFSMGNWIAGTFTTSSLRYVSEKTDKFNLSVITPGIDKEDAVAVLKNFAPNFDSIILAGYPPFIMDVVLSAKDAKVDLSKLDTYFLLAGENFSEEWRNLILESSDTPNELNRVISIYGTADAGVLGHETPLSVALRKLSLKNSKIKDQLFGEVDFLPTVVSYHPEHVFFETLNGELLFSTMAGIPLVRYNIKDHGLLLSHNYIESVLKSEKLYKENSVLLKKWKTPMVVLKGRNDVVVTFYALNIYPENIKAGLENPQASKYLTGKYVAKVEYTKDLKEQKLKIAVELRKGIEQSKSLREIITTSLYDSLVKLNTEYRKLAKSINEKAIPEVELVENGHEQFIVKKSKHKWVKKF